MKRNILIALCLLLCIVLLANGCSKQVDSEPENTPTTAPTAKPTATPVVEEVEELGTKLVKDKITLRFFGRAEPVVNDYNDNKLTTWYEERTNVHIEWEMVDASGFEDKRNLILASGDLPDVFFLGRIGTTQQMIYGAQGLFVPLNDYIEEYGVGMKRLLSEVDYARSMITAPDGNIYGLPSVQDIPHLKVPLKTWVYQPWLDKLGLEVPETTEEFYQMLKAFKEDDPNGNGIADEIPFTGYKGSANGDSVKWLMNSFIYHNLTMTNGKIDTSFNKPEWREGLEYIHKLYSEGLLYNGNFTIDKAQLTQLGENEIPVLGAATAQVYSDIATNYGESGRFREYRTAIPPLEGPNGVRYANYSPYNLRQGEFVITSACEYPEIAYKWADYFFTEEGSHYIKAGLGEGTFWRWAEPGEKGIMGDPGVYMMLEPYGETHDEHWGSNTIRYLDLEYRMGAVAKDEDYQEIFLTKESFDKYLPYIPKEFVPSLWYDETTAAELSDIQTTINNYCNEMTARFITGDLEINDANWNQYVAEFDKMQVGRYIEIMQKAYDDSLNK